jgi:hypothetical protein
MKNICKISNDLNRAVVQNLCLHAITGRAPENKGCANGYDCGACPFDQMLDDMKATIPPRKTARAIRAA